MTKADAEALISKLTLQQKLALNELLKYLERKRQLSQALPPSKK